MKTKLFSLLIVATLLLSSCASAMNTSQSNTGTSDSEVSTSLTYPIVDSAQGTCYNNSELIDCLAEGEAFYGQDAQYTGNVPSYTNNGDGTVSDNVTGLVWTQEISSYSMPWSDASSYCESLDTGDVTDWRLPSLKELWSLRDFSQGWPWVDTAYFHLVGDGSDARQQHSWSSNLYLVNDEYQNEQVIGDPAFVVNDWTGHIKAMSGNRFVRCVSGDEYGINKFVDNGDNTITDEATGLTWAQNDSGEGFDWEGALAWVEEKNTENYLGYSDWRLPNIIELQSIADYSGVFPAINTSFFNLTQLTNIKSQDDYPFYWSSTSNPVEGSDGEVENGTVYAWVLAAGYNTDPDGYDLHGAGSVVFTPKSEENFSEMDPEIHRYNYVRLVRGGNVTETPDGDQTTFNPDRVVVFPDGDTGNVGGGPGGQTGTPGGQQSGPDLAAAAAKLEITEDVLIDALGDSSQGQPDFAAAATKLGITEAELMEALGITGQPSQPSGQPPAAQP